jgi:hypothetical protein
MRKLIVVLVGAILCTASNAKSETIFDLSSTTAFTNRSANSGVGQSVAVSTTTTITDMGFYLNLPNGGDVKFMIWDSSDSNLLFSSVLSGVSASGSQSWVYSDPFSFTLNAGQTYWFGVIADNNADIGFIAPEYSYSANGLSAVFNNSNYTSFSTPSYSGGGGAEIGLRLDGGETPTPTPEPSSIGLLGMGLASLAGIARRRFSK